MNLLTNGSGIQYNVVDNGNILWLYIIALKTIRLDIFIHSANIILQIYYQNQILIRLYLKYEL